MAIDMLIEGVREHADELHTSFGRFAQDMFDQQVAAEAGSGGGSYGGGAEGTEQAYEVAQSQTAAIEPPGPEAFDNPRGYLEYLKFSLEIRIEAIEYAKSITFEGDPNFDSIDSWAEAYEEALRDINSELSRLGGPRASKVSELYNKVVEIDYQIKTS